LAHHFFDIKEEGRKSSNFDETNQKTLNSNKLNCLACIARYRLFILFLMIVTLASCGKKRIQTEAKIKRKSAKQIQKKVIKNDFEIEWFSAKAKVSYTEPDNYSQTFNANVRVKTDSAIWISIIPLLGIEMARILITTRLILNYYKMLYWASDFISLNALKPALPKTNIF